MQPTQSLYISPADHAASRLLLKKELEVYHLAESWVNARDGSLMRLIPGGVFVMGSSPAELVAAGDEGGDGAAFALEHETPQVRVLLHAFYMGVYAVTNGQFIQFLNEAQPGQEQRVRWLPKLEHVILHDSSTNTYRVETAYERHPVVHVSWSGAEAYCKWANLRLPSEIEWEKAARGVDARLFSWGEEWNDYYLQWHRDPSVENIPTAPVDAFPEGCSPYGLFQMAGNVEEWCADSYQPAAYQLYAEGDVQLPVTGQGRVVRGGSCVGRSKLGFRCAMRRAHAPGNVSRSYIGFRCACGTLIWTKMRSQAPAANEIQLPSASDPPSLSNPIDALPETSSLP